GSRSATSRSAAVGRPTASPVPGVRLPFMLTMGYRPNLGDVAQLLGLVKELQLLQRLALDLADALAGDVEGASHLIQRARVLAARAKRLIESTSSGSMPVTSAISSAVGSCPSLVTSMRSARPILLIFSTMCTGMRIARALSASARAAAWRIHQVA